MDLAHANAPISGSVRLSVLCSAGCISYGYELEFLHPGRQIGPFLYVRATARSAVYVLQKGME